MTKIPRSALFLLIGAMAGAAAPAIATSVVRFARNADKVDGLHAVDAEASRRERAGKLVATNRKGRLPRGSVGTARNALLLGGNLPAAYDANPCKAQIAAHAFVPADPDPRESAGTTFTQFLAAKDPDGQPRFLCAAQEVLVAHPAPGVYEVDFSQEAHCIEGRPPFQLRATVGVKAETGPPLVASSWSVCRPDGVMVERVRIAGVDGTPADAAFTITLFGTLPIPPIP